jgi:hypothetical protein
MESQQVIIHCRAAPNGTIVEIGERPQGLSPHEWYDFLRANAIDTYQTFSGARGLFRLERARLEALKAASVKTPA